MLTDSVIQQFAALRADYLDKLADKAADLQATLAGMGASFDRDTLERLQISLRNLAGSGGTFGFPAVSDAAKRGEHLLTEALQQRLVWNDATQQLLATAFADLQNAVSEARQGDEPAPALKSAAEPRRILSYAPDSRLDYLATPLMEYGFQVHATKRRQGLLRELQAPDLGAILADYSPGCLQDLASARQELGFLPPVVFCAEQDDFAARLAALRAGGRAFFLSPVDPAELLACLAELTMPVEGAHYRVLLIDDDTEVGGFHGLLLEKAGLKVRVVKRAADALPLLSEFSPEVIVTDLYMPDCDGLELAALLRQIPQAIGIPIVFLSSEQRLDFQMQASHSGGNDFLTKPVKPERLLAAAMSNAQRYRATRVLMARDSLTGLFNHSATHDLLETELLRARREKTPLCFALLDLDYFKRVNDGFGHTAGDRVLKSLAHLLTQRLRRSDFVGRVGGEEFGLILPNTTAQDAVRVLDDLRERFARLPHHGQQGEFRVELSAGVAEVLPDEDVIALETRADSALYAAKRAGRNRVMSA